MAVVIKEIVSYPSGTITSGISIQSGGFLAVENGAKVYDVDVQESGAILQVKSGGYVSSGTVQHSGYAEIAGSIENVKISETGTLLMQNTAQANEVSIQNAGFVTVESGAKVYDVEVSDSGSILQVNYGGSASSGTVCRSGYIENTGVVENIKIGKNGTLVVNDAAQAYNIEVNGADGILLLRSGGYAADVTVCESGYIENAGMIEHLKVAAAGSLMINVSGGTIIRTELTGSGAVANLSGAILKNGLFVDGSSFIFGYDTPFSSVVLKNGGAQTLFQGSVDSGTRIFAGGLQQVSSGAAVYDAVLLGRGVSNCTGKEDYGGGENKTKAFQRVYSGGYASHTIVHSSAGQILESGASADKTEIFDHGSLIVSGGGVIRDADMHHGVAEWHAPYLLLEGDGWNIAASASCDFYVRNGGYARYSEICGCTEAETSGIIDNYDGWQTLASGGSALYTTVLYRGLQGLSAGAYAENNYISRGGGQSLEVDCTTSNNYILGGIQYVGNTSGGIVPGKAVNNFFEGGEQIVYTPGLVSNTVMSAQAQQWIQGGSAVNNLMNDASQFVQSGTVKNNAVTGSGAIQWITNGSAVNNTLQSGARQVVSGGVATDNDLLNAFQILYGGTVFRNHLSGEEQTISGGTILQMIYGGYAQSNTLEHASQWVAAGRADDTVITSGAQIVETGVVVRSNTIISGDQLIYGGSALANRIVSGKQYLTHAYASGSILSNTALQMDDNSVAEDVVLYGGSVADCNTTTIRDLTLIGVNTDFWGTLHNLTIDSDCAVRFLYATVTGNVYVAGSVNQWQANVSANFTFAVTPGRETGNNFLNQYLAESTYSIYVDPEAAAGNYLLINDMNGNTETEDFIICNSAGRSMATISAGESVSVLGRTYKLVNKDNQMRLTVSAFNDALAPVISGTPSASVTGNNAEISWSKASGSGVFYQVEVNGITYTTTENRLSLSGLYAGDYNYRVQAISGSGNESRWTNANSFTVQDSSLQTPVVTQSTTERTNQNVTLNATVPAGMSVEYRMQGEEWTDCTGNVTVKQNGAVQFRTTDNKGNYSDAVSVIVTNIDKEAPGIPVGFRVRKAGNTVNVSWKAAEQSDLAGYRIRYGNVEDLQGGAAIVTGNSFTISDFSGDTLYYQVQTFDTTGNFSEWSYVRNVVLSDVSDSPVNDVDGTGIADIVMAISDPDHPYCGAVGAWLIQESQCAAWGDLSTLASGWVLLDTGKTSAAKTSNDIYIKSADNVVGAWVTDCTGKVSAWQTIGSFDASTEILGCGDFNGDGQSDLLLRNTNGAVGCYFTSGEKTGWNYFQSLGDEWKLCGIGDLNGDGRDDVVLKHDAGFAGSWLTQEDGTMAWADLDTLPDGFEIAGCGDFNGDGIDDVLLRKNGYYGAWLVENGNAKNWMGLGDLGDVTVEEISDFNADGKDDLRIRTASGDLGAQIVKCPDTLQWQYYGSVGSEWSTAMVAIK